MNTDELANAEAQARILAEQLIMKCRQVVRQYYTREQISAEDIQDAAIEYIRAANDNLEELIPR